MYDFTSKGIYFYTLTSIYHKSSFLEILDNGLPILQNGSFSRFDYILRFEQRFARDQSEEDILHNNDYWTQSYPHENSGPCETYDPPFISEPGNEIGIFFILKDLDSKLDIFLHEKGKFFYSKYPGSGQYRTYLNFGKMKTRKMQHAKIKGNIDHLFYISPYYVKYSI